MAPPMPCLAIALLLGLIACPAQAAAAGCVTRRLMQASGGPAVAAPAPESEKYSPLVPAVLELPASCLPKYTCPGVGPQIYTCNGTSWTNTNSSVAFKCEGGVTGVHSIIAEVPSYTFSCGFAQGRTQGQIMVPGPRAVKGDLPIYRREAFNTTACVSGIKWITRTATHGGAVPTPTCTQAEKGKMQSIDYVADFTFWMC